MRSLVVLSRWIDRINTMIGEASGWLVLVIIMIGSGNAIIRKLFNTSSNAWLEGQWVLFAAILFFCSSWTLRLNEHIRIDIISSRLRGSTRRMIDIAGHALFLLPLTVVVIYTSFSFVARSVSSNEQSMNPGGLPQWLPKSFILIGFVLLFFQAISEIIKCVAQTPPSDASETLLEQSVPTSH